MPRFPFPLLRLAGRFAGFLTLLSLLLDPKSAAGAAFCVGTIHNSADAFPVSGSVWFLCLLVRGLFIVVLAGFLILRGLAFNAGYPSSEVVVLATIADPVALPPFPSCQLVLNLSQFRTFFPFWSLHLLQSQSPFWGLSGSLRFSSSCLARSFLTRFSTLIVSSRDWSSFSWIFLDMASSLGSPPGWSMCIVGPLLVMALPIVPGHPSPSCLIGVALSRVWPQVRVRSSLVTGGVRDDRCHPSPELWLLSPLCLLLVGRVPSQCLPRMPPDFPSLWVPPGALAPPCPRAFLTRVPGVPVPFSAT